jgi:alpha-tubulin suppressor-like RCC1 family protein
MPVSSELSFMTVSAGGMHSCALTEAGVAYCWGEAPDGQIGAVLSTTCTDHYEHPRELCALVPTAVAGGLTFRAISAGGRHTCALDTQGALYCWGAGAAAGASVRQLNLPTLVPTSNPFAEVSAGSSHTCALDEKGRVWCWGENRSGQLGLGAADTLPHPTPQPVATDLKFRTVSAGGSHSCAITTAGAAYCWGSNETGQLGDGTVIPSASPQPVSGGLRMLAISAGASHTCVITENHLAYCWGSGDRGELGTGLTVGSSVPARVFGQ